MATTFGLWLLYVCTRCVSAMRHAKNLRTDASTGQRHEIGTRIAIERSKETDFCSRWTPLCRRRWIWFRSGDVAGYSLRLACLCCDRGGSNSTVAFAATAAACCRQTETLARAAEGGNLRRAGNQMLKIGKLRLQCVGETGSRGETRRAPTAVGWWE